MDTKKISAIFYRGGAVLVILALIGMYMTFEYTGKSIEDASAVIRSGVESDMEVVSQKVSQLIRDFKIATDIGKEVFEQNSNFTRQETIKLLGLMCDEIGAKRVMYCDIDGIALGHDDVKYDISGLSYAVKLQGDAPEYFYVRDDGFEHDSALIYMYPLLRDDEKYGYILTYIDGSFFREVFASVGYGKNIDYAILADEYSMIYGYNAEDNVEYIDSGYWEKLTRYSESNSKWYAFSQKVRNGEPAFVAVNNGDDRNYIIAEPISNTNWTLLAEVDQNYLDREARKFSGSQRWLRNGGVMIFALILLTYVVISGTFAYQTGNKRRELEGKADTDQLTGLSNKVATERMIRDYIVSNPGVQSVMILIDVDNFKKINDTQGHAFGDEVLRQLGIRLRSLYRMSDVVGRIGGDEFVVFLKDIRSEEIIVREAKKLEVFFQNFEVGEYVKYSVTASLGVVIAPEEGTKFEELYRNADKALYTAKKLGKKQLAFYRDYKDKMTNEE